MTVDTGSGVRLRSGEPALLLSAALYGVSTTGSVVALRIVRPADLLAEEIAGASVAKLVAAAVRGRLHRRGALRQVLLGTQVAGVACGAVAGGAFNRGIAQVPATRAGQLANLTPVVGTLTAVGWLGDRPSP